MSSTTYPFDSSTDISSLKGKGILITGANTGLGKRTAIELAEHDPSQIWMTARDASQGEAAIEEVRAGAPSVQVSLLKPNLSSFASIKSVAKKFIDQTSRLDILYLNAGILGHPQALTEDGFEIHMGVNHIGHALLFKLLTPLLLKTATESDIRVVSLTSLAWKYCSDTGISLDKLKEMTPNILPTMRYCQSKLANKLYAKHFAAQYPQITIVSVHPGEVQTELFQREAGDEQVKHLQTVVAPAVAVSIEHGVKNQLWAGTAQDIVSGEYYEPVGIAEELTESSAAVEVAGEIIGTNGAQNANHEAGRALWEWTQKVVAEHSSSCGRGPLQSAESRMCCGVAWESIVNKPL